MSIESGAGTRKKKRLKKALDDYSSSTFCRQFCLFHTADTRAEGSTESSPCESQQEEPWESRENCPEAAASESAQATAQGPKGERSQRLGCWCSPAAPHCGNCFKTEIGKKQEEIWRCVSASCLTPSNSLALPSTYLLRHRLCCPALLTGEVQESGVAFDPLDSTAQSVCKLMMQVGEEFRKILLPSGESGRKNKSISVRFWKFLLLLKKKNPAASCVVFLCLFLIGPACGHLCDSGNCRTSPCKRKREETEAEGNAAKKVPREKTDGCMLGRVSPAT